MLYQGSMAALALTVATLGGAIAPALAFDDAKYPEWKGQWSRAPIPGVRGNPSFDRASRAGAARRCR